MLKKVLLIDDEENFCAMIKDYLVQTGRFEVCTLSDPRQALQITKEFKPDIVLLDLRMPHISGFEVCQILNDHEETKRIPIVILTALLDDGDKKEAFLIGGATAYLTKPVELDKLVVTIDDILDE